MVGRRIARQTRQNGITLLELLVVMAILALLASLAVFNAPPPRSSAKLEAERFAARIAAAMDDAVLLGAVMSVEITDEGYAILRYANGEWKPDAASSRFAARAFPREVAITVTVEEAARANRGAVAPAMQEEAARRIVFDPIGVTPAFVVEFVDNRGKWRVEGGGGRKIEVSGDDGR